MRTAKHPKPEYRLTAVRTAVDPAECQRRLGRVYRLILSYNPQKKAAIQGEGGEAAQQTDCAQSTIG
jgi:hypothetical protein